MCTYCFFSAQFLPTIGGVERYTYNLAQKMLERGDKVVVVTSALPGQPAEENLDGIAVFRVPTKLLAGGRLPVAEKNRAYAQAMERVADIGIDRIIIQTRLYRLSLLGLLFARQHTIPAIILEHGSDYISHSNPIVRMGLRAYEHMLLSRIRKLNPVFYAVSKRSSDWLEHFGFSAKGLLHNSIDLATIQKVCVAEGGWRGEYGIPPENLCVAFAGRLIPEKGPVELAKAVLQYNTSRTGGLPGLTLLLAGDGTLKKEDFPEDGNIHLLGSLSHEKTLSLLKESEIFCLPTNYPEGFPTSVLEAAACGCLLIATDRGGSGELILDERYGILVPDNAPATLAKALAKAASDPGYRRTAAEKGGQRVAECFTFDALYGKISGIWETVGGMGNGGKEKI